MRDYLHIMLRTNPLAGYFVKTPFDFRPMLRDARGEGVGRGVFMFVAVHVIVVLLREKVCVL